MFRRIDKSQVLQFLALVALGVLTRTVFHIAPNFEFVTAITLLSATKLKAPYSFLAPFITIIVSDTLIGNTNIFLFTWSGFALAFILGLLAKRKLANLCLSTLLRYEGLAVASVLVFYFWTNFGVVLTTNMYPLSLGGYQLSLIMALPFLKMQLISAVLTMPILVIAWELITKKLTLDKTEVKHNLQR
jgi:hypothetical protein